MISFQSNISSHVVDKGKSLSVVVDSVEGAKLYVNALRAMSSSTPLRVLIEVLFCSSSLTIIILLFHIYIFYDIFSPIERKSNLIGFYSGKCWSSSRRRRRSRLLRCPREMHSFSLSPLSIYLYLSIYIYYPPIPLRSHYRLGFSLAIQ